MSAEGTAQDTTTAGAVSDTTVKDVIASENKDVEGGKEPEKSLLDKEVEGDKEPETKDNKDAEGDKEPEKSLLDTEVEGEEDKGEDKDKGKDEDPVLDKYEFVAPEGVELDQGLLGKFEAAAKELGIGNKAAQKIVEVAALHSKELMEAQKIRDAEIISGFKKEIMDDPNSRRLRLDAQAAIKHFGADNKEFKELTGQWVGNHPGLVRFLANVGSQLREADSIDGDATGGEGAPKSRGEIFYPEMKKKK